MQRSTRLDERSPTNGKARELGVRDFSLSFVVPARNEESVIGDCLRSIDAVCRDDDEIIVVDNESTDNTVQIAASFPRVTIVSSVAPTVAGVRNEGARHATGMVLAFVDADCVLRPEWRKRLTEALKSESVAAAGGGLATPEDGTWVEKAWMCGWAAPSGSVGFISTANLAVRTGVFQSLGGFDESLETDEDTDFSRRVLSAHGTDSLIATPGMTVVHLGSATTVAEHWRRQYWHAAGLKASVLKHGPDKAYYMTVGFVIAHILGILGFVVLPLEYALLAGLGWVLTVPFATAFYRLKKVKCVRWLPHLILLYAMFYYARCLRLFVGRHEA